MTIHRYQSVAPQHLSITSTTRSVIQRMREHTFLDTLNKAGMIFYCIHDIVLFVDYSGPAEIPEDSPKKKSSCNYYLL